MRQYAIILHPDTESGGYCVSVPALSGCVSQGDTIEEAIAHSREAIALHIAGMVTDGESIPEETAHPQAVVIDVAAQRAARRQG